MKILYIGGGFVGACSAAVSADSGHEVLVYDINSNLVRSLASNDKDVIESCLFEQGLGEMIIRNSRRLIFTDDISSVQSLINEIEAIFMCLPTPEKDSSGQTDLAYYEKAASDLAQILVGRNKGEQSQYVLIINKSTVPIDMVGRTAEIMNSFGVKNFGIGSNPEFLVEGKAIEGSIRPARVVVGAWTEKDFGIFRDIYKRFCDSPNTSFIEVNPYEAAAGKLLANYILFNRLATCFDVVGRTCEQFDQLHFENVRRILICDKRIGDWGFYDSLFAGGSCFIKDARSLSHQLQQKAADTDLVDSVLRSNQRQLDNFMARAENDLKYEWTGKKIGILGLAFKRDTNDIRNSASLGITEFLLDKGVEVIKAYDSVAGNNYMKHFANHHDVSKVQLVSSEIEAINESDVIIIATDWPQFREIYEMIKINFHGTLIMDGRRMLHAKYADLTQTGYDIIAVGARTMRRITP